MAELREFQLAAVDRIVSRLTDPNGSRRFLLADEVGLGKTLVAKGVIDELKRRGAGSGFTLIYICSNSEIADQNRDKLCDEKENAVPGRLTLMALQSQQIEKGRADGRLQVFAFTPGTSLKIEHGTGIAQERRLLLYLLFRVWRKRINRAKWRRFFRCTAGEMQWELDARFRRLRKEFFRNVAVGLQARLKKQWESQHIKLLNPETGKEGLDSRPLRDCIDACVDAFASEPCGVNGRNRNRVIGELRRGLARVSLEFLEPNLVILDEFQRFSDILLQSRDDQTIVGKLFAKRSSAILILSATPYKMYTLAHENEDHHQDFLKTLAFLKNEPVDGASLTEIQQDLASFRNRLALGEWATADDPELFALRARIEDRLKEVMCRTERSWYLADVSKGVTEITAAGVSPEKPDLVEYVHLRQFLLSHKVGDWNITDFWKSSPSVLSFMDGQYGLISRIRRDHLSLPPAVLRATAELPGLAKDNAKCRLFFEKVFGDVNKGGNANWKYLWVRPTYTYYNDTFFLDREPTKYLAFSHWRFVPKTVSVLTSREALKRIGRVRRGLQSAPLQFRKNISFYHFDACYPSLALASCVNQLQLQRHGAGTLTEKQLFIAARREIKALLKKSGVQLGKSRTAPLWKIIAKVESHSASQAQIRAGLADVQRWKSKETSEHLLKHTRRFLTWMDDDSPLSISPLWLNRLTNVALYSPAISLLRSFLSIFPQQPIQDWASVLKFCFGTIRHYFNKRLVQTIIRRHGKGSSYAERILSYCQQGHFQAVLDEYAYLVRHVLQQDDAKSLLAHLERAMGMWSGSPGVNERTRKGHISRRSHPQPAHFALAFGDDVSSESLEPDGKARKSAVREAFNSPFWPFVLATTSVGQEGLDFHLYCRDIVHWNLPSNPVDLEQREGRINRFDGLSIRRNIGNDFPLATVCPQEGENLWKSVFLALTEKSHGNGRFKHGLFPHWIYQSQSGRGTTNTPDQSIIRRHLLFYAGSRDCRRYADLKNALALYRLVFGQPRQQDILEQVVAQRQTHEPQELNRSLAKYMINLSPFTTEHAVRCANAEAQRLLRDPDRLQDLLQEMPKHMRQIPPPVLDEVQGMVSDLIAVASGHGNPWDETRQHRALGAILYLLDPYDAVHDRHGVLGYVDDVKIIREAHTDSIR